jgi:hypothetical protein
MGTVEYQLRDPKWVSGFQPPAIPEQVGWMLNSASSVMEMNVQQEP